MRTKAVEQSTARVHVEMYESGSLCIRLRDGMTTTKHEMNQIHEKNTIMPKNKSNLDTRCRLGHITRKAQP